MRKYLVLLTFTVLFVSVPLVAQNTANKQLTITVNPSLQPLVITTASLPSAYAGSNYTTTLAASGGLAPYTWSVTGGTLPAGLTLNASTGTISGTPTTAGSYTFTVTVKDSFGFSAPISGTAQIRRVQ